MAVLAAVSGERHSDRVVEEGLDLANAFDEELVVLHVMSQEQFQEIRDSSGGGTQEFPIAAEGGGIVYAPTKHGGDRYNLEDAETDAAAIAEECVEETLTDRPETLRIQGRVGDPAEEILGEADRVDAAYLVVGGRKRSPTGKALFGSVTQSVILSATVPVVSITYAD